jgi:hypothetical protein
LLDVLPDDWERPVEPEKPAWSEHVFQAFRQLDADRASIPEGLGLSVPGRIPFSAVDRWARRYDVAGFAFDVLLRLIDDMDSAYLAHVRKGLRL